VLKNSLFANRWKKIEAISFNQNKIRGFKVKTMLKGVDFGLKRLFYRFFLPITPLRHCFHPLEAAHSVGPREFSVVLNLELEMS